MTRIEVLDLSPTSTVIKVRRVSDSTVEPHNGFWDDEAYDLFIQDHEPSNEIEYYED